MTLAETIAALKERFTLGETTRTEAAVTGEPYIVICSGGIKSEGAAWPALCPDESTAVRLWLVAFEAHAMARGGDTLYLRRAPELTWFHMTLADKGQTHREAGMWCAVYSRLLVSEKRAPARKRKAEALPANA